MIWSLLYGFDFFKIFVVYIFSISPAAMRIKSYWLLERKTKFCSDTRSCRFKGISRYRRTQVQSQIGKMQPQLLKKLQSDLQSFHKMLSASQFYPCGDPSAFSVFSSCSFARKLSLQVWGSICHSRRGMAGTGSTQGTGRWGQEWLSCRKSRACFGRAVKSW